MKNQIKKLKTVLKNSDFSEEKQAVVAVYLTIVLLGYKIPETASYFKLSEIKVQSALTVCGVKLQKSRKFLTKIHKVAKAYKFNGELELAA